MTKEILLNLPVKDVEKSKRFFSRIGFALNEKHGNGNEMACYSIGEKNISVLLFPEETFKGFAQNGVSDTRAGSEVLISLDAESREEVDDLARKVFDAGGTVFSEPKEIQGWMYGCGFADPDGHRWNVVFMDFGKMQQA